MTWLVHTATLEPGCEVAFIYDRHGNFKLDCDIALDDMDAVTRRRFDIEFEVFRSIVADGHDGQSSRAWRVAALALALAAAALAFWVAVVTVGRAAPAVTSRVTDFQPPKAAMVADLRHADVRPWMVAPSNIPQPRWLMERSDAAH